MGTTFKEGILLAPIVLLEINMPNNEPNFRHIPFEHLPFEPNSPRFSRSQSRETIDSFIGLSSIDWWSFGGWQDRVGTSTSRPANDQRGYMALKQWPRNQVNWLKLPPADETNRPSSEKIERLIFINSSCKHCFGKNSPIIDALWCRKRTLQR